MTLPGCNWRQKKNFLDPTHWMTPLSGELTYLWSCLKHAWLMRPCLKSCCRQHQRRVLLPIAGKSADDPFFYRAICLLHNLEKMQKRVTYNRTSGMITKLRPFTARSNIDPITLAWLKTPCKNCALITLHVQNALTSACWSLINGSPVTFDIPSYLAALVDRKKALLWTERIYSIAAMGVPHGFAGLLLWTLCITTFSSFHLLSRTW